MKDAIRRICVTPVRNEAWVLPTFLAAAKMWATEVIVADQLSTDGTRQILDGAPGVIVVRNDSQVFDERHRQELLLNRSRKLDGKRILIGLDADEALSANVQHSDEWRRLDGVSPGTVIRLKWVNILPGFQRAWIPPEHRAFGFVDDGSEHTGRRIHSPRVPCPPGAPVIDLDEVVVLHFQYVAWDRMLSKHRWYQTWEYVTHQKKRPLEIFREYRHMYGSWDKSEVHPIKPEWLEGYQCNAVDFSSLKSEPLTWWDCEVLRLLAAHGVGHFRRLDIWDVDWNQVAALAGVTGTDLSDPRSLFDKAALRALRMTQGQRSRLYVRALERFLRLSGW